MNSPFFPTNQGISVRVLPRIPATLIGAGGIGVSKVNGQWTITPAWDDLQLLAPGIVLDPTTKEIWVHDPVTDIYSRITLGEVGKAIFWGTSTDTVTVGAGVQSFHTQSGKDWAPGMFVQVISQGAPTSYMIGAVTSYVGGLLTINVSATSGFAAHSDWLIVLSGQPGTAGSGTISGGTLGAVAIFGGTTSINSAVVMGANTVLGAAVSGTPIALALGSGLSITGGNTLVATASGSGDVVGPAGATDLAIARFNTTTGKLIQNSVVLMDTVGGTFYPVVNASGALGKGTQAWSNLFLASAGVINWANGTTTITHVPASNSITLSLDPGNLQPNTTLSIQLDGVNEFLFNSTNFTPGVDAGNALGVAGNQWAGLFLSSGSVIGWASGNVTLTHSSGILTLSPGDLRITTVGVNAASVMTVGGTQTISNKSIDLTNNTLTGTVTQFNNALAVSDFYVTSGPVKVALGDGGTGNSLTAPTVDRMMMYDVATASTAYGVLANLTTHASPAAGDFVLLQRQGTDDLVKVNWNLLPGAGGGAPISSAYVTIGADATLTAERSLATGAGLSLIDGGANSTVTIGSTADDIRFNSLGLGVAAPTLGRISQLLGANAITGHLIKRFTDTAPTGNFLDCQSAAAASLFTVDITGQVTVGAWGGTAIGATKGGTGQTVYAVGDLLFANTTTTLARLADVAVNSVLISGGIGVAPSWGAVNLATAAVTGNLSVNNLNGGSGAGPSTFWCGNGTWASASGSTGISGGVLNQIALFGSSTTITAGVTLTNNQLIAGTVGGTPAAITVGGDLSLSGSTFTIANNAVTYAKMTNSVSAGVLLGRGTSGVGNPQEISLGSNLSMSGTTLNSSGGSGIITANSTPTSGFSAGQLMYSDGTLTQNSVGLTFTPPGAGANLRIGRPNLDNGKLELCSNTSNFTTTLQAGSNITASRIYLWPTDFPAATGQVLASDTSGNLSWASPSSAIVQGTTVTTGWSAGQLVYSDGAHAQNSGGITVTGLGGLQLGAASSITGSLVLANTASAFTTTLQAGVNVTASRTYAWPTDFPASPAVLTSSAAGVLTWVVPGAATISIGSGVTSGTPTRVLFEDTGPVLADNAALTFAKATGQLTATTFNSTQSTGTAPFTVASTTVVGNLNASLLGGATFASPGAIGSTSASTGAFTTVNKVTITAPATAATLTIANNKTLTYNNSITMAGTDATTMTFPASNANVAALNLAHQNITGGATATVFSNGSSSFTVDCGNGPIQSCTITGAITITNPAADGSCIILATNSSATSLTFSAGFTVGSNTGDAYAATGTNKYSIFIWRANGISGYRIAAHQ